MTDEIDVAQMALGIRNRDEGAAHTLYHLMRNRFPRALRKLGPAEFEDKLHDAFTVVIEAIRGDKIRDPHALLGYVHAIIRTQACDAIKKRSRWRATCSVAYVVATHPSPDRNPEQQLMERDRIALAKRALLGLKARDREVLLRFYVSSQPKTVICAAMNLTDKQFGLLKSRAKAKLEAKVSRLMR